MAIDSSLLRNRMRELIDVLRQIDAALAHNPLARTPKLLHEVRICWQVYADYNHC